MKRRSFLATAAVAGGAACRTAPPTPWRSFTEHEAAVIDAAAECLIPADSDAGAHQAQVVRFIDVQLSRRHKRHLAAYRDIVRWLDNAARSLHGQGFTEIGPARQAAILADMERGPQKPSFDILLAHTLQGYFGMPRHGGNSEYAGWRTIGVPPMPVRGRLHYQQPPEGKA